LGIGIPLSKGIAMLDPVFLGAYACLGVVFAAPAVAQVSAPAEFGDGLRLVARQVVVGFAVSWAALVAAVVTVYLTNHVVVGPDVISLAECGLFGLMVSFAASTGVAFVNRVSGGSTAAGRIFARLALFGLLAGFYFRSTWLPAVALEGAAISAAIALLFLGALWFRK
jgi:hypothetical protein